jgi:ubiquitin-protein ligase
MFPSIFVFLKIEFEMSKAAHKRLMKEFAAIQIDPPPYITAKPLDKVSTLIIILIMLEYTRVALYHYRTT